jgi:hypothetical protein
VSNSTRSPSTSSSRIFATQLLSLADAHDTWSSTTTGASSGTEKEKEKGVLENHKRNNSTQHKPKTTQSNDRVTTLQK